MFVPAAEDLRNPSGIGCSRRPSQLPFPAFSNFSRSGSGVFPPARPGLPDLRPQADAARPRQTRAGSDPGDHRSVTPSLHVEYKTTRIKQYHKEGRALRTETTINDTWDFNIGKRLTNLPALREIGFHANRRLLGIQRLSHDPISGTPEALHTVTDPVITPNGTRVPGLRLGERRVHALLQALLMFGLSARDQLHRLPPVCWARE